MPLYEYRCERCGMEFERIVFNESEKIECPECQGRDVRRLMSVCAFSIGGTFKSTAASSCNSCTASAASCSTCGVKH